MRTLYLIGTLLVASVLLAGCRGSTSPNPPIHPNLNMDFQEKFEAQEENPFFADNAAMRQPVPGTVARGLLKEDTRFYAGRTETGEYVEQMPVPVSRALVLRGREQYDIYCTVCHGQSGDGQGIIMTGQYGYTPAPTYHAERLREIEDGYLYDVTANGVRSMPGYAQQIAVADRWAIVAYIRALQRSQNADADDLPPSVQASIRQGESANMNANRQGTGGGGDAPANDADAAGGEDAPANDADAAAPAPDAATEAPADTAAPGAADPDTTEAAPADTASGGNGQ